MPKKRLTTNGNVFRRTDGRWQSVIWYFDEQGIKRRKVFSSKTKTEAQQKITNYIAQFNAEVRNSDESQKTLKDSLTHWLQVFKFPSVERTTYDRLECTAQHQVFPLIGDKIVGDITAADLKSVLNHWMEQGYAYTTVKKVHILLNEYFRYLTEEDFIQKNPMQSVPMMKKANFLAAQDKDCVPEQEQATVFTATEIAKFKREAFSTFANGKRKYQQAAAYILMLNTGLRTGELLGLLNSDIDLERRIVHLERGVKEVWRRDGLQAEPGRDVKVGKLKSATSKRTVPLNDTAIAMIQDSAERSLFRRGHTSCAGRAWQLHKAREFPQTLLPHFSSGWHRKEGPALTPSYVRLQFGEWHKASGRHHQILNATPGSRPAGALHIADNGVVLRQKRHLSSTWYHGRLQSVNTMRQDAQKTGRKFCGQNSKKERNAPGKARKRRNWVRFGCWRGKQR